RRAERLHMPVASSSVLASPSPEGWPLSSLRFEADIGFAFATAHSVRLAGLRRSGYPKPPPAQLHVSQAFHMASTFQLTREIRLSLTHRRTRRNAENCTAIGAPCARLLSAISAPPR